LGFPNAPAFLTHAFNELDCSHSFECVIVAACIVVAVGAAFGTGGIGPIKDMLAGAISTN
jgi:hypothetical protein